MDVYALIERFYPRGTRAYTILIEHSLSVTALAFELADKHLELPINRILLYEGAMLHDIGIFLTNAPEISCFGREPYHRHGYLGANLLRREGLEQHALICERHTGSGITHEEILARRLALPLDRTYLPTSLEEQLICYADCFYSKTKLGQKKDFDTILAKTARFWSGQGEERFSFEAQQRLIALHRRFL